MTNTTDRLFYLVTRDGKIIDQSTDEGRLFAKSTLIYSYDNLRVVPADEYVRPVTLDDILDGRAPAPEIRQNRPYLFGNRVRR